MLSVQNLVKTYGSAKAVKGVSFEVRKGDIFTLLGPSGCGKTTTLQCIAGLEVPTSGGISMAGNVVYSSDSAIFVPSNKRRLGMVFQSYAIWPHMSVFDNVAFPLVRGGHKIHAVDIRKRVLRALDIVKMGAYADRPAPHLSGGQQQRIALARAIVHEPRLLLLDEPLSNLDAKLRDVMRVELRQLIKDLGITTIFVTHDQMEALSMSDHVVLMRDGKIVQEGSPRQIYLRPETSFASDFLGRSNLIPAEVLDLAAGIVKTPFGLLHCVAPDRAPMSKQVCVTVRPQAIEVKPQAAVDQSADARNCFTGRIVRMYFLGDVVEADVEIDGYGFRATFSPYWNLSIDDEISIDFGEGRCVIVSAAADE